MSNVKLDEGLVKGDSVTRLLDSALDAGEGLLRLTPTWVPRSFLHPGRRIKLHPGDYYRFGADRGGIDERWFGSTTDAANEGRVWHEGQSFCLFEGKKFMLKDAVAERGADLVGEPIFSEYDRWPVYSKFFDNMGPIPHHMHQSFEDAELVGQEGKPESYYFPPQLNNVDNNFAYTFMGLEPGTEPADVRKCLENWNAGDNGILDLSRAYRLKRGTGWLIPPGVLHAPGSLCTYEPQWGSDVFGMYQSIVEGRYVPWSLLVKDMPEEKHQDLDFIVGQLDWDKNVDTHFKNSNYLEPIRDEKRSGDGYEDLWVVYGTVDGKQCFSAKELTIQPGAKCTLKDGATSSWITVQGRGRIGSLDLQTPAMIHFGENTTDEVFISHVAATQGVEIENLGSEPLVGLRYFGPDAHSDLPKGGS
ncbi:cupin domain-containing protein [Allorhodopirellula solitaria]|uniref:Mannose-6-phosphate isomerase n=1 Tax=Allorhodopirellula solitaria TaxID=2527987 RepID=A0A5C5XQW3_9BACT|nr:hypothetical protein [Allorhodopirellula solitaria]TWT65294.1 hypothetical protein CA85_32060 [Allorhodopirellula solitaria]